MEDPSGAGMHVLRQAELSAARRRRFSSPSGRTGISFGTVFSQQAVGADESQESDRLPACYAAHLGVLDHKSAER